MPIWHQSPKLTPRYFLETPRLFGYPNFHKSSYFPLAMEQQPLLVLQM